MPRILSMLHESSVTEIIHLNYVNTLEKGEVRSRIKIYLRISMRRLVVSMGQSMEEMLVTEHNFQL